MYNEWTPEGSDSIVVINYVICIWISDWDWRIKVKIMRMVRCTESGLSEIIYTYIPLTIIIILAVHLHGTQHLIHFIFRCWCSALPVPSAPPASLSLELSLPTTECQWPGWDPTQCPQCRHLSGSESGGVATEWPGHLEGSGGGCLQTCWWGTPGPGQRHRQEI